MEKYISNKRIYMNLLKTKGGGNSDTNIYFIRHGMTSWNKERRTQGQENDPPLNDIGTDQAKITGKYLRELFGSDCLIISSPLTRAKETANIINKEIGRKDDVMIMDDLKEIKMGLLSGLKPGESYRGIMSNIVNKINKNNKDPIDKYRLMGYEQSEKIYEYEFYKETKHNSGIELWIELKPRIKNIIHFIRKSNHHNIVIVSHSGFLEALIKYIFKIPILYEDMRNGKNCWISYCVLNNNKFIMISPPNTLHLKNPKMKILFIFFQNYGAGKKQWKESNILNKFEESGDVYTFDNVCASNNYKIEDIDFERQSEIIFNDVKSIGDRFFLISHSRGYMLSNYFGNKYKNMVIGSINIDGGKPNEEFKKYLEENKKYGNTDDHDLKKILKLNDKIEKSKVNQFFEFRQYKKTMMPSKFPILVINNIYDSDEINILMDDYVKTTLNYKFSYSRLHRESPNVDFLWYVGKDHFMYRDTEVINEMINWAKKIINLSTLPNS
jgi:broad specificity phosphatase PhoE